MTELLGLDIDRFVDALAKPRTRALRLNPAKVDREQLRAALGVTLGPVPWCSTGFTVPEQAGLGGHPAHLAGLYYLQEPSAMAVAEALAPQPGWRVADLAAAPGGKTTHISALLGQEGFVLANDVSPARLGALHESIDLWGAHNVLTSTASIGTIADQHPQSFDGVVLDAPCSGEGLFRRRPASARDWSPARVAGDARRQEHLLNDAALLVAPDGVLVYSTCTFEVAENEDRISAFLDSHPDWAVELAAALAMPDVAPGVADGRHPLERTARLWPHLIEGEGQYVARLRAPSDIPSPHRRGQPGRRGGRVQQRGRDQQRGRLDAEVRDAWRGFHRTYLPGVDWADADVLVRGDVVFRMPSGIDIDQGLLARPGLALGRARPGRFEPAAALATAVPADAALMTVRWDAGDPLLSAFLSGHPVEAPGPDGWVLACWHNWPVGWGKRSGGTLKNMLPKHVTRMYSEHSRAALRKDKDS